MPTTLNTPVAKKHQPQNKTKWTVKVFQKLPGMPGPKLVHTTTVTALTRDAIDSTRVALAAQGYMVRKSNFSPSSTIIVDATPVTPVLLASRQPPARRAPKLRVTSKNLKAAKGL